MDQPKIGDDLLRALKELPKPDMDPRRARRIRDRAVAVIDRERRWEDRWLELLGVAYGRLLEPALAGALSVGTVAWALAQSIEVLHRARGGFFWP